MAPANDLAGIRVVREELDREASTPRLVPEPTTTASEQTRLLVTVGATIAALYYGSEVFVPIALAILLSFVLAPGVRLLHGWHLGRIVPVLAMTLLAFMLIFGLSALIAAQFKDLAGRLPQYETTIARKAEVLRGMTTDGALSQVSTFLSSLSHRLSAAPKPQTDLPQGEPASPRPMPVTIRPPDPDALDTLRNLLGPLIHPLAIGGIVVVYVIFILLQREDLRNRLIRLFGAGDLHRSTAAIDDAARRLSRYLLAQLGVNTTAAVFIGAALWLVGVPSPLLWGVLFGCLRFVPYVGPPLAAVMPILLAAAVDPGWSIMVWTIAIFIVTEAVVGQIVEPFFYGHNTGLSPVAVIVAATFWTTLWGPIGLILATPITVCLVVIGRHVEHLRFLDVLLGDQPPLSPPEVFYQRMLANDPVEASDQAYLLLKDMSLTTYHESVVLPALLLAQEDVTQGRLDTERQRRIAEATAEVIEDLSEASTGAKSKTVPSKTDPHAILDNIQARPDQPVPETHEAPDLGPDWRAPRAVLCLGSRGPLDDAAATVLAQLLRQHGFGAEMATYETLLKARIDRADLSGARIVVVSCLDGDSAAYLRFVMRRLRRKAPGAKIMIGAWWRSRDDRGPSRDDAMGDGEAGTLSEAVAFCISHASAPDRSGAGGSEPAAIAMTLGREGDERH